MSKQLGVKRTIYTVVRQDWTEYERDGWAVQRPDGYSLHLNEADCKAYIDAYWKSGKHSSDYYQAPAGKSWLYDVEPIYYAQLLIAQKNGKRGIRCFEDSKLPQIEAEFCHKLDDINEQRDALKTEFEQKMKTFDQEHQEWLDLQAVWRSLL